MFKKCQVIMIPNEEGSLYLDTSFEVGGLQIGTKPSSTWTSQHLYIVSDNEIKEGDWYLNNNVLFKADDKFDEGNNPNINNKNKKIIATTDKLLIVKSDVEECGFFPEDGEVDVFNLPQLSQSFIEKYVVEYNISNIITNVMVEYTAPYDSDQLEGEDWDKYYSIFEKSNSYGNYESIIEWSFNEGKEYLQLFNKLKINPKDNTITIRNCKDTWSREEVIALYNEYLLECLDGDGDYSMTYDTWLKDRI